MNFKIRAHESFFIRKGWLYKVMKSIDKYPRLFSDKTKRPTDELGVGSNMVKSMRYWIKAVGLTEEVNAKNRASEQYFTDFGKIVWKNDKYFEEMGTLWLLHYKLASNIEMATSWYYFFNCFDILEFTKDDFVTSLDAYMAYNGESYSKRSFESDFDVLINTYIPRAILHPEKVHPENNIDSQLGSLNLISIEGKNIIKDKKEKVYRKSAPKKGTLHPLIALAVIVDQKKGNEIRINDILYDENNVGRIFNIDSIELIDLLYQLQKMEHIHVTRTAGLDTIQLTDETMDFCDVVKKYYNSLESEIIENAR